MAQFSSHRSQARPSRTPFWSLSIAAGLLSLAACSSTPKVSQSATPAVDPRIGLKGGMTDAGKAAWNLKVVSETRPPEKFVGSTNSDLAFIGNYAIQGNYNGFQVWDITNPTKPVLKTSYYCPASQSDVSVYKNLLFVSAEAPSARLDCGGQGVRDTVSTDRIRGIRIFDITDIGNPKYISNVQTCRGSHTHTVVEDPKDKENIYIYVSGSSGVRSPSEMPTCVRDTPDKNPNSSLFQIEVIQVPLANPAAAKIINGARIFDQLTAPKAHGETPEDIAASKKMAEEARAKGAFTVEIFGSEQVLPDQFSKMLLDSLVTARGGSGAPTGADSAKLRAELPGIVAKMFGPPPTPGSGPRPGPNQCHDITVYPAIGRAGGACGGYGLLLDISNPANPVRIGAAADSNFSFWHSATFNNDGTKILFSDEWGGGSQPRCRSTDKPEWGSDAIFTIENKQMVFKSYYKLSAAQTSEENCVSHNGSLIPIPGRDIMVQGWYQGGVSVFDWTDPSNVKEIAYFDRGPMDATKLVSAGSWSAYWYNGYIFSSDLSRGLDIFDLLPSGLVSQNEIDAAKSVKFEYFNAQDQPKLVWPASFSVPRAYLDQLERNNGLSAALISSTRAELARAEKLSGQAKKDALSALSTKLHTDARSAGDQPKAHKLAFAVGDLAK